MVNSNDILADMRFSTAAQLLKELEQEYEVSPKDILEEIKKRERSMPVSVFNKKLSPLETVSKYLRENKGQTIKSIAELTQRSEKTVWQAYASAKRKMSEPLLVDLKTPCFPIPKLQNRSLSILENIVLYMKENLNMKFSSIADALSRDDRTIWTVYSRAKKKQSSREKKTKQQKPKTKQKTKKINKKIRHETRHTRRTAA